MGTVPWTVEDRKRKIQEAKRHLKSSIRLPRKETRDVHRKNASSGEKLMA
jgi:hypothetical protein